MGKCGPRPLPYVGDLQPNEGRASIFSKKTNTLNQNGIRLWRPPLGDPRRPRLSRQMDEFLVFIAIFEQNVAIMLSLWGSPTGIRLWRPLLGDPRRPRLSRQMSEFWHLSLFFEQHVAIMSSFWGSAPAKPRQLVGNGAQAKLKQWVNFGD